MWVSEEKWNEKVIEKQRMRNKERTAFWVGDVETVQSILEFKLWKNSFPEQILF